jgi:hypothetical protein
MAIDNYEDPYDLNAIFSFGRKKTAETPARHPGENKQGQKNAVNNSRFLRTEPPDNPFAARYI